MTAPVIPKIRWTILLIATCMPVFCTGQSMQAKGTYDFDCMGYTFHLPAPNGSTSKAELTLRLEWRGGLYPPAWESATWTDVKAQRCAGKAGECEDAMKAQIRFEKIKKKRLLGDLAVEFGNVRREEHFDVKYHRTGPRMICE